MVKIIEFNSRLYQPSAYSRVTAKAIKALPVKFLPIISAAADIAGKIMTSSLVEMGMRAIIGRAYDLGGARRLARGEERTKLTLSDFSLSSAIGWPIPQSAVTLLPKPQHFDWKASLVEENKTFNIGKRLKWEKRGPSLPSEVTESAKWPDKWIQGSAQLEFSRFGEKVQKMIEELIHASSNQSNKAAEEHLCMAIELPDGTLIPIFTAASSGEAFSCALPDNYKELERKALQQVSRITQKDLRIQNGKVKIYHIHTHPEIEGMYIERDRDGRYITALSRDDYVMSEMDTLYNLARRIRVIGHNGTIEIIMGAVPALTGEKIGEEVKVATYTQKFSQAGNRIKAEKKRPAVMNADN